MSSALFGPVSMSAKVGIGSMGESDTGAVVAVMIGSYGLIKV